MFAIGHFVRGGSHIGSLHYHRLARSFGINSDHLRNHFCDVWISLIENFSDDFRITHLPERPKLSDSGRGTRGLQPERDGQVRCSVSLGVSFIAENCF